MTYQVVFESHDNKYRIAGVGDNPTAVRNISGVTASKGTTFNTAIMDYTCNSELNNEFYVVYIKNKDEVIPECDTFFSAVLKEGEMIPSEDDIYLYKLEKSATGRVDKINSAFEEEGITDKVAIMQVVEMNKIYNINFELS